MPTSGTSKPKLLPHQGLRELDDQFSNLYVYIMRHPGPPGPTIVVQKQKDGGVYAQFGDWSGIPIDPTDTTHHLHHGIIDLLANQFHKLQQLMQTCGLTQAQYYFSETGILVDVRMALNRYIGPGMLHDVFGKLVTTPEIIKVEVLDQRVRDAIEADSGSYSGELIVKPSRFREMELPDHSFVPLYAQVLR